MLCCLLFFVVVVTVVFVVYIVLNCMAQFSKPPTRLCCNVGYFSSEIARRVKGLSMLLKFHKYMFA
jgi:hypothetical protein